MMNPQQLMEDDVAGDDIAVDVAQFLPEVVAPPLDALLARLFVGYVAFQAAHLQLDAGTLLQKLRQLLGRLRRQLLHLFAAPLFIPAWQHKKGELISFHFDQDSSVN